jgi:hypothetical protein
VVNTEMLTTVTSILPVEEVVEEAPAPSSWGWKEVALGALLITVVVGGVVLGVIYFGNPLPAPGRGLGQEVGKRFGPGAIRAYHSYIIREHGADIVAAISHVLEARNSFNSGGSVTTIKVTLKVGSDLLYEVHQALHAHYGHLH